MSTPGFDYIRRVTKSDGTNERIELSSNGHALKKYTPPDSIRYSSVQSPHEKHSIYSTKAKSIDAFEGFRATF